ncbi:ABC transporter ATP-binding protein [Marivita hallyeonensis]|uniref:ABC-2 type transport system ATP-binding protein n=1 Tax=Marivita hallyeonensis TaxID=996342 RepID=A0A1M5VG04_9RHOB|nr:ABC transporter ATP-binding protein [Marivita hallyeonensis]SHH74177.1 ABC-2 type transport system ATP-binding protein [Marivita hallyeonensis]
MALSVSGLSYAYGYKQALTDVGFDVATGQFAALLGPNGAGKSTLFALLTRLFATQAGTAVIAGHDVNAAPLNALAQLGVVFQQSTLDLDLTVQQNLRYFAALHGLSGQDVDARISAALGRLDMAERANEKVRGLNGGHRRRTEIARALLHEPKVLLLDEPTVGLDAPTRAALVEYVHGLCSEMGVTVLWTTHLTDEVWDDDQVILLHRGRVLADGRCGELRGMRPLAEYFAEMTERPA